MPDIDLMMIFTYKRSSKGFAETIQGLPLFSLTNDLIKIEQWSWLRQLKYHGIKKKIRSEVFKANQFKTYSALENDLKENMFFYISIISCKQET